MHLRSFLPVLGLAMVSGVAMGAGDSQKTVAFSAANQSAHFELKLPTEGKKPAELHVLGSDGAERLAVRITPDQKGDVITLQPTLAGKEKGDQPRPLAYVFWPPSEKMQKMVKEDGMRPQSWHGQWLHGRVDIRTASIDVWMQDLLVYRLERKGEGLAKVTVNLPKGAEFKSERSDLTAPALQLPLDISRVGRLGEDAAKPSAKEVDGVQFQVAEGGKALDLGQAGWPDAKRDPASFYETYDQGVYFLGDPRQPLLRVPVMDYVAAHVLASASDDPKLTNVLTLRTGPTQHGRPISDQVTLYDHRADVPRGKGFVHVVVPMSRSQAQNIVGVTMDLQPTKDIFLARHKPDPARFRWRPLGLPSGVKIEAITLELSPLQMTIHGTETGNAFVEPQKPAFKAELRNISDKAQTFTLGLRGTNLEGQTIEASGKGTVEPGKTAVQSIELNPAKRGYYDLEVELKDESGRVLISRKSSFALLPPDTRKHRETSPFGTWDFGGGHFTCSDPDVLGPLYVKMGLHYGMFSFSPEALKKWGILRGNEFAIHVRKGTTAQGVIAGYDKRIEKYPDTLKSILIFHEDSISGRHETRVPDLFHDRPAYKMDETEQKRFKEMWDVAAASVKGLKARDSSLQFVFGNGPLTVKEEFLRQHFPADLFEALGNETGNFGRPPESQPPDTVAYNASLWMDRQLLDAYGYKDKLLEQCCEIGYPSSNPGNLSETTQANYFARMALDSLGWGIPRIRLGGISDAGNSYGNSNWGMVGFCHAYPALNVKPAFVSMATLTLVLDGAKFEKDVPLGSPSLYAMQFKRPDGKYVTALWTIRGTRAVTLKFEKASAATVMNDQGNETALEANSEQTVTLSDAPCYLISDGPIQQASAGRADYTAEPEGKATVLAKLDSLSDWTLQTEHDSELEYYNFMCPRRKGDFQFKPAADFEGRKGVLQVTPRPIKEEKATMPMYAVLKHNSGIAMPGRPTDIGLWVNGNSSWGRIIFEFKDASGQRWISIGAQQTGQPSPWLEDWMPKNMISAVQTLGTNDWNTNDVFGLSRINFDGWRYLSFPLPGQYAGEQYSWPANSQWKWDKDGIVHYPLTFTRLVVELPEKTLHVKTYAPAPRAAIYLSDLTAVEGPTPGVKKTVEP
jgi:hypothetical protein